MIRQAIPAALAAISVLLPILPAAAEPPQKAEAIEHAQLLGNLTLLGKIFHVQGVDLDSQHIWVTSVDVWNHRGYLHEFDRTTGKFIRRLDLTDGPRYHPGGFSIANHSIWVPVSEYRAKSSAVLEEIDPDSLQITRKIHVADHLGCVAASDHYLIAGNWDSKQLYIIDLNDPAHMRVVPNPSPTHYQDMKMIDGQLVAGGNLTRHSGSIDWIDYPSMKIVQTLRTGETSRRKPFTHVRPYTGEGMTLQGRDLYVLPEDGPSRLFHFKLDDDVERNAHSKLATLTPG
jgi:hypothetical protein